DRFDRLVMQAVDFDAGLVDHLRQPRPGIEAYPMKQGGPRATIGVRMLDRRHPLVAEILVERAAERDVQELLAATDAESRQVVGKCPARQGQLGPIARRLDDVHVIDRLFAVLLWRDISTARKDNPIET